MVIAYHVIFGAYGCWMPDDPRGTWSAWIRAWELFREGERRREEGEAPGSGREEGWKGWDEARRALRYSPVLFDERQREAIGRGFAVAVERSGMEVLACAIMPQHVHVVVRRHRLTVEKMRQQLKGEASKALVREGAHPLAGEMLKCGRRHSPWADEGWDAYLDSVPDVRRAIRYVEENPVREGRARQEWAFVRAYR